MPFVHTPDNVAWKAAFEHYNWDRMDEAYALIEEHGIGEASMLLGSYRLLEAEWVTRQASEIVRVRSWLQFETIPDEIEGRLEELVQIGVDACDEVVLRLRTVHGPETLIAILAAEVDRPWATNPYGYCVDKYPYDKICLPHHLVHDLRQYREAVAHEYAHVVSLNLSQGHAPRWLSEAISVLVERDPSRRMVRDFRSGRARWRAPDELEGMFNVNSDDVVGVQYAYEQAGLIGRFLAGREGGEAKLSVLLRDLAEEGLLRGIARQVRSQTRVDQSMRRVYGMSEAEVFARAFEGLRED